MSIPELSGVTLQDQKEQKRKKEPYANSMRKLHALLSRLQKYELDYRLDPKNISDSAFAVLKIFFSTAQSILSPDVLLGAYGSIIYHDPVDLDADVVVVFPHIVPRQRRRSFITVSSMLNNLHSVWPVQPFHADIFIAGMDDIKKHAPGYTEGKKVKNIDITNQAAHVLTAKLFFDDMSDVVKQSRYQGEIFALARAHPSFRQGVIARLSEIVAVRKERRAKSTKRRGK